MSTTGASRLLLLRHGQIASHRGDTPLTDEGRRTSLEAGRRLGTQVRGRLVVRAGPTLRTRQTAKLVVAGAREAAPDAGVDEPRTAFALRNPDLYAAGERVDMVSTPEALADQIPHLSPAQCATLPFFGEFMPAADRVGWWLAHPDPPGDDAAAVAARIRAFARSLLDVEGQPDDLVVGITHSPILRAVALDQEGRDPGEPRHLTGLLLHILAEATDVAAFDPFTEHLTAPAPP